VHVLRDELLLRRESTKLFGVLLLSIFAFGAIAFPRNVQAQSSMLQPLEGFAWPSQTIAVNIQTNVSTNAKQAVLAAMNTWNLAQRWFIKTYENGVGVPYSFYETNQHPVSGVSVTFNKTQTRDDTGWTSYNYWWNSRGIFTRVAVSISLDLTLRSGRPLSQVELQALATHELGHALGLDHTTFSKTDLMNHYAPGFEVTLPSTLNLYALYLLSKSNSKSNLPASPIMLPAEIPYANVPASAVPEFEPATLTFVAALTVSISAVLSKRRKSDSHDLRSIT